MTETTYILDLRLTGERILHGSILLTSDMSSTEKADKICLTVENMFKTLEEERNIADDE